MDSIERDYMVLARVLWRLQEAGEAVTFSTDKIEGNRFSIELPIIFQEAGILKSGRGRSKRVE